MIKILFLVVCLTFVQNLSFAGSPICGQINFVTPDVPMIQNLMQLSQPEKFGYTPQMCGLPGENFLICRSCEDPVSSIQMQVLQPMLTAYAHRLWHKTWHDRQGKIVLNDEDVRIARDFLLLHEGESREEYQTRVRENRGEDFLFMHRQMIKMVQLELTAAGQPCIAGWSPPPASAFDKNWPKPDKPDHPDEIDMEQLNAFFGAINLEVANLESEKTLRKMSLNQYGSQIQFNLHIMLHTAYMESPEVLEGKCQGDELYSSTCDNLGSNASSAYNKHFWKLHGYIDSLIGKWLTANGYREIAVHCDGRKACYEWKGTFLGNFPKL
jgi:hypothetical protein